MVKIGEQQVGLTEDKNKTTKHNFLNFNNTLQNKQVEVGKPPFQGCISELNIGGKKIDLNANSSNTLPGCNSSIDLCEQLPCQNGICKDDFNDFKCECPPFYTKKTCNETLDINCAFKTNLCNNNGQCVNKTTVGNSTKTISQNGVDMFTCNCNNGYEGVHCENMTNECESDPCKNNGTCTDGHLDFECACRSGYTGKTCVDLLTDDGGNDALPYIIGFSVLGAVILIIVIVVIVAKYCRDKSGMEGTYSPNKEEQTAGNVEMSTVKKPKTERLI